MPRTITRLSVPTVMSFRTAQTRSKPEEQWRVADVAHGYIGKNDVGCEQLGPCRLPDVDGDRTIHPRSSRGVIMGSRGTRSTACPWICSVMEATMSDFFPGFEQRQIGTSGATINLVTGARGGPPLLPHGYPPRGPGSR